MSPRHPHDPLRTPLCRALPLFALVLVLSACGNLGGYVPRPARVVNTWEPSPAGVSAVSTATPAPTLRRHATNTAAYRVELLEARDDEASHPLGQVGVGFPVRDWISGYFLPSGAYVAGSEWDRSSDGDGGGGE